MNILFIHREFPGHFKFIAPLMAKMPNNLVLFITAGEDSPIEGVNKLQYPRPKNISGNYPFIQSFEENILHGQEAAKIAMAMKERGIKPDIIFGLSWGSTMFMKDIFPDVPLLCYFEWFENADGKDPNFENTIIDEGKRAQVRASNTHRLIDLAACDGGICPTEWQKQQFPKEFHHKIKVIHDGVDTDSCCPDSNAKFVVNEKLTLSPNDEVITYATRGMEPARGFPQFMEAIEKLQKKRPNVHFVIGGNDSVFYSEKLTGTTYKEQMLSKVDLDMSKVHFVGGLDFVEYLNMLRVSSAHVYSTIPFVLSWSIIEAMSVGCCVVASNTAPVLEVIQDNYNGLLFDFNNVDQLVEKIEYALDNKTKVEKIRQNARQSAVEKYDFKKTIPMQIQYMYSLIKK